jgi:hypothetical protein
LCFVWEKGTPAVFFESETLKHFFLKQTKKSRKASQKRMGKSTRSRNSQEEDLAYDTPERKRPNVANDGAAAAAAAAATNARRIDGGAGNRGTVYYKYKFEPF